MDGFYFGGSIINKDSLRTSILYYDSVIHYDVEKFFRSAGDPYFSDYYKREEPRLVKAIDSFYKDTILFRQEGLLRLVPLSGWTRRYRHTFLYLADLFSRLDFIKVAEKLDFQRLVILHDYGKTPILHPTDDIQAEEFGYSAHFAENKVFSSFPKYHDPDTYTQYVMRSIGREVTYGLLGGTEFDAIPFSDLAAYTKSLEWLIRELTHRSYEYEIMQKFPTYQSRVAREVIKITVPNFNKIPNEELLNFRRRRQTELIAFRSTMDEVTNELIADDRIDDKFLATLHAKLAPRVSDLKNTIEEQVNDMRKKRIENALATSINILGFAMLPFEAVVLSTMLILGKITTDEIGGLLDKLRTKRKGLYILWELNKHSPKRSKI